ncbi:hypothetical protein BpHYR1_027758 [Brachionus plicatilis]|uniref:Uncharacterized protein n=1 Tax=Brachionus plicatilis TaxID=10195 RepID=A0A3M7RAU3_BRAPC|nr:hypothetical protein BpHYR1_027758 [Brachionus plicatilis]
MQRKKGLFDFKFCDKKLTKLGMGNSSEPDKFCSISNAEAIFLISIKEIQSLNIITHVTFGISEQNLFENGSENLCCSKKVQQRRIIVQFVFEFHYVIIYYNGGCYGPKIKNQSSILNFLERELYANKDGATKYVALCCKSGHSLPRTFLCIHKDDAMHTCLTFLVETFSYPSTAQIFANFATRLGHFYLPIFMTFQTLWDKKNFQGLSRCEFWSELRVNAFIIPIYGPFYKSRDRELCYFKKVSNSKFTFEKISKSQSRRFNELDSRAVSSGLIPLFSPLISKFFIKKVRVVLKLAFKLKKTKKKLDKNQLVILTTNENDHSMINREWPIKSFEGGLTFCENQETTPKKKRFYCVIREIEIVDELENEYGIKSLIRILNREKQKTTLPQEFSTVPGACLETCDFKITLDIIKEKWTHNTNDNILSKNLCWKAYKPFFLKKE